jgi:predicted amidophosphoribosyltransferase
LSKKPRFFCDNCGIEVGRGTRSCPNCGRFFASVRCPACGFSGEDNIFTGGCPACGYSAPPSVASRPVEKKVPASPLPLWVYVLSIIAFIIAMAILVSKLAR